METINPDQQNGGEQVVEAAEVASPERKEPTYEELVERINKGGKIGGTDIFVLLQGIEHKGTLLEIETYLEHDCFEHDVDRAKFAEWAFKDAVGSNTKFAEGIWTKYLSKDAVWSGAQESVNAMRMIAEGYIATHRPEEAIRVAQGMPEGIDRQAVLDQTKAEKE